MTYQRIPVCTANQPLSNHICSFGGLFWIFHAVWPCLSHTVGKPSDYIFTYRRARSFICKDCTESAISSRITMVLFGGLFWISRRMCPCLSHTVGKPSDYAFTDQRAHSFICENYIEPAFSPYGPVRRRLRVQLRVAARRYDL